MDKLITLDDLNIFKGFVLSDIPDMNDYQPKIDNSNKLTADFVDDTLSTNKFVTSSEKSNWNDKQDALISGTNIKTINNQSLLGSGNINISGGGGGGDNNVELVHFTLRQGSSIGYNCEYTLAEITDLIDEGKELIAVFQAHSSYNGTYYYLPMIRHQNIKSTISGLQGSFWLPEFYAIDLGGQNSARLYFSGYFNNVEIWNFNYKQLSDCVEISSDWDDDLQEWGDWIYDINNIMRAINLGKKVRLNYHKYIETEEIINEGEDDEQTIVSIEETNDYVDLTVAKKYESDDGEGGLSNNAHLIGFKMSPNSNTFTRYYVDIDINGDMVDVYTTNYTLTNA